MTARYVLFAALVFALSACARTASPVAMLPQDETISAPAAQGAPFHHIVIEIQENRSFDDLYAGAAISGALTRRVDYSAFGYNATCKNPRNVATCGTVALQPLGFESPYDPNHSNAAIVGECNVPKPSPSPRAGTSPCRMNGFESESFSPSPPPNDTTVAYAYLPVAEIGPYVSLANAYGLADRFFSAARGPSFPGHVFLVSGLGPADDPPNSPWGCPEASTDRVPLFFNAGQVYPCFDYRTVATLLDAKRISWKYYTGETPPDEWDGLVNAFAAFRSVYSSRQFARNVVPRAEFFDDIGAVGSKTCGLPAVSWVTPNGNASDHAGFSDNADGPYWVGTVYEAIAQSACYRDTALLVLWDDSGGWFDHVPPPFVLKKPPKGLFGYRDNVAGFRVPLLFIASNAKPKVSSKPRDFGAVLSFIEKNFGLPKLGGEDLDFGGDALDDMYSPHPQATIAPIPISQIMLKHRKPYSVRWFLEQPPAPADDQ